MRRLALILCTSVALTSAGGATVEDLAWLHGCWHSTDGGREVSEHWMKPKGKTMLGLSRTIAGGKTVAHEFMRIVEEENGDVFFIAQPSGQKETSFKLVTVKSREVVFANPAHDFPQRVIYRLQEDGSLLGRIEGMSKGKERAVDFPMQKTRCD
ncbi:DUF6265 family protein [soil metagenome]|nr:hypothetical protein [Chthoniobacterales bacterium]